MPDRDKTAKKLQNAAVEYLKSIGADVVVIGPLGMMPSVDLALNHYLVVKWTGTLPVEEGKRDA